MKAGNRIIDSYMQAKKEDGTIGTYLAGGVVLGKNTAKLIMGSSLPITLPNIKSFIFDNTQGKLVPVNETFKDYGNFKKDMYYASIITFKPVEVINNNPSQLKQINSNSFLEENVGNIWEKRIIEGKPYFFRENNDDIEEIFENVQYMTASSQARNEVDVHDFLPSMNGEVGTEFFTFSKEGIPGKAVGVIKSCTQETATIIDGENEVTIPLHAILSTVPIEGSYDTIEEVIKYLKKAYGEGYGARMDELKKKYVR